MITTNQINYVAGLLEGEGSFIQRESGSSALITIGMTDLDVIRRLLNIIKPNATISATDRGEYKTLYSFAVGGTLAIQWMMMLYPLMGDRRKTRIRRILSVWKSSNGVSHNTNPVTCRYGHPRGVVGKDFNYNLDGSKYCLHCRRIKKRKLRNITDPAKAKALGLVFAQ